MQLDRFERTVLICIVVGFIAILAGTVLIAIFADSGPKCQKSHTVTIYQPTLVGKVTVMQPIPTQFCDEYAKH